MERRVVITGLGVVTPVGVGRGPFWEAILAGRHGFAPVRSFDTSALPVHLGAEVGEEFRPEDHVRTLDPGSVGRASQLAIAAARLALEDAGLEPAVPPRAIPHPPRPRQSSAASAGPGAPPPERCGVAMGTTSGEPREVERFDDLVVGEELERLGPEFIRRYPCHVIASHVAAELGFGGPNVMIPTACAAGNYAIAHAHDLLRLGRADLMLAGGADAFSRITYHGFARLGAIAPDLCRPFDRDRRGMIPGEGAAVLVLEPRAAALERGARIYAEVAGYGLSCDAHHMTAAHPEGRGAARAMERALADAGVAPEEVSYVSAHGTGTPTNDRLEVLAFRRVFGEASPRVPISSIKSMLGHTMGAASAIEAAACALAVHTDRIPPTAHFTAPDPEADGAAELDFVPNEARDHPVAVAMNNAYAFGGNNASVLFRKHAA
ncbi:MAG TPA: beta-ketoacyl-[acyl-carrier-protein] synthase family protein [Thermoanaerobaculia bacterium]|nr:beta-ketoacyl-[acyl-carrier-protein] synthase family protein [Thermoanaerobaculia bacterium]